LVLQQLDLLLELVLLGQHLQAQQQQGLIRGMRQQWQIRLLA
jgi:hypothetical protein